jgi:hypothetical protein
MTFRRLYGGKAGQDSQKTIATQSQGSVRQRKEFHKGDGKAKTKKHLQSRREYRLSKKLLKCIFDRDTTKEKWLNVLNQDYAGQHKDEGKDKDEEKGNHK